MTPKEKAVDLFRGFFWKSVKTKKHEKESSLICVNEILKYQPFDIYTIKQCEDVNKYWNEVKQEIEKL